MTDDEILDQWHGKKLAHDQASDMDVLEAYIDMVKAEDAAITRFGLGPHNIAYRARFLAKVGSS